MRRNVWFSCGAASAVAAKIAIEKYGNEVEVLYCDTLATEHPDNARFFVEVQRWIGKEIKVLKSYRFSDIDDVFEKTRFMAGPKGARCTAELKKLPRVVYQRPDDIHIFGYTADEQRRADEFEERNQELHVEWVLIREGIKKEDCFARLRAAGIAVPLMYSLGFDHNNCLGCVKATSAGYWNRTRRLFPEVFERRAKQSRLIGAKLVRIRLPGDPPSREAKRHYLDELPPDADAPDDDIECGPVCQLAKPEDLSY